MPPKKPPVLPTAILSPRFPWPGAMVFCAAWLVVGSLVYLRSIGEPPSPFLLFSHFGLGPDFSHALLQHGLNGMKAAWVCCGAFLLGRYILRLFPIHRGDSDSWETAALSGGLGIGAVSYGFFFLGAVGILTPVSVSAMMAFVSVVGLLGNRDLLAISGWKQGLSGLIRWEGLGGSASLALFLCLAGASAVNTFGPEVFFDSLVYHLALPQLYLLEGRLVPVVHNVYAGFPMLIEFFYGAGLALGGEGLARLLSWGIGLLILCAFLALAGPKNRRTGWLAAVLFFSTPFVFVGWGETGIDNGTALFALLTLLAARRLLETANRGTSGVPWAVLCGIMSGLTLSCKYTAWGLGPVLWLCLWKFLPDGDGRSRAKVCIVAAGLAAVLVLPWVIKNCIFYANPIFPFFHDGIAGVSASVVRWEMLKSDAWGLDLGQAWASPRGVWGWLTAFWRLPLSGPASVRASFAGPLYGLFLPFLGLWKWRKNEDRLAVVFFLGLFLVWLCTTSMLRLFTPGLAILAFLIARLVLEGDSPVWLKRIQEGLVFFMCLMNACWCGKIVYDLGGAPIVFGRMTREDYLSKAQGFNPYPSFPAYRFINAQSAPQSRVLVLGDSRGFYLERPFLASSIMNESPFVGWIREAASSRELAEAMRRRGITHVVLNAEGYNLTKDRAPLSIPRDKMPVLEGFWDNYLEAIFPPQAIGVDQAQPLMVYRLLAQDEMKSERQRAFFPFPRAGPQS